VKNFNISPQRRKGAKVAKNMQKERLEINSFTLRTFASLRLCGERFGCFHSL
jgi:hypothetical protein